MAAKNDSVFVDSNFFIALFNKKDALHEKVKKFHLRIKKEKPKVFISNLVFSEVVTVLSQRAGRRISFVAGDYLWSDEDIRIIYVTKELSDRSWQVFKEIPKKNMSLVDCSILTVMDAEGIEKLLTFDQEDFAPLRKKYRFSFF